MQITSGSLRAKNWFMFSVRIKSSESTREVYRECIIKALEFLELCTPHLINLRQCAFLV